MADLGSDFSCVDDLDANLTVATGRTAYKQSIARRLSTQQGELFYDASYGRDLRRYLNESDPSASEMASNAELEALEDERTLQADGDASFSAGLLDLSLRLVDAAGPFELVLSIDAVSVEILNG